MITLEDLTPAVIILLIVMITAFFITIFSPKISKLINKKYEGDYTIIIKIVGLLITIICSITIILIIRG